MSVLIPRPKLDLIDLLLGEHASLLSLFQHIDKHLSSLKLPQILAAADTVEALLMAHVIDEDALLFNALPAEHLGMRETLDAMFGEHEDLRRMLSQLRQARRVASARSQLVKVIDLAREHLAVEERVLFGLARQVLGDSRITELGTEFARRRGLSFRF